MRLGFVSDLAVEKREIAQRLGLGIELIAGTENDPFDLFDPSPERALAVREDLERRKVPVLTILFGADYIRYCDNRGVRAADLIARLVEHSRIFGTGVVTMNAWVPEGLRESEALGYYKKTWSEIARVAEDGGIRVAIENCPHDLRNVAYSPAMWERMFDAVPSEAIGLEYDPSHLVWLGVDYIQALRDFAGRVYAFHAKDTQVFRDKLARGGYPSVGWWRYRIPGHGEVNWKAVFVELEDTGYAGDVIIEHEDPLFEGIHFEKGLAKGAGFLRKWVC